MALPRFLTAFLIVVTISLYSCKNLFLPVCSKLPLWIEFLRKPLSFLFLRLVFDTRLSCFLLLQECSFLALICNMLKYVALWHGNYLSRIFCRMSPFCGQWDLVVGFLNDYFLVNSFSLKLMYSEKRLIVLQGYTKKFSY